MQQQGFTLQQLAFFNFTALSWLKHCKKYQQMVQESG